MNSLVKVFSNFKEFYNEINGATLTGAIDVIVVEQPNGEFQCSPFHVRFGKLGVLRSREKIVDIEINGEPVDIHMKLGESGEAFFVEECTPEDVGVLPDNLATSPIPVSHFPQKFTANSSPKEANNSTSVNEQQQQQDGEYSEQNIVIEDGHVGESIVDLPLTLPLPRRNSIDFSTEIAKEVDLSEKFENQQSDYSLRRHTDNTLERRNLSEKVKEYTTHKLRQKWAEHEEIFQFDGLENDKNWSHSIKSSTEQQQQQQQQQPQQTRMESTTIKSSTTINSSIIVTEVKEEDLSSTGKTQVVNHDANNPNVINLKEESKSKKRRRRRSQLKKKNSLRKSSTSSSISSSSTPLEGMNEENYAENSEDGNFGMMNTATSNLLSVVGGGTTTTTTTTLLNTAVTATTNSNSSNDESSLKSGEGGGGQISAPLVTANTGDESLVSSSAVVTCQTSPINNNTRIPNLLDIHFFSDTEVSGTGGTNSHHHSLAVGRGGAGGRPTTPVQSDSELEISMREKEADENLISNSASWKWGELPTPDRKEPLDSKTSPAQAQRNSMLSSMFNFMKKTNKIRQQQQQSSELGGGGIYLSDLDADTMNPEIIAKYFPNPIENKVTIAKTNNTKNDSNTRSKLTGTMGDDDRESGNGTSIPQSPSSMDGQKSLDSDFDDGGGKLEQGKYLDLVAMSLCGLNEKQEPTEMEFDQHLVTYKDVCENPSIFSSPNLVVRLNGKYYSWTTASPIVMTIIAFQKPLTDEAVKQLTIMNHNNNKETNVEKVSREIDSTTNTSTNAPITTKRSWWYWRRSYVPENGNEDVKINDTTNEKTQEEKISGATDEMVVTMEEEEPLEGGECTTVTGTATGQDPTSEMSERSLLSKSDSMLNNENTSAALVENLDDLSQASISRCDEVNSGGDTGDAGDVGTAPAADSSATQNRPKQELYRKTLRLSSKAIKQLNLKEGMNEIEFSVTTAYQGTTRCKCYLFHWKHNDKVVISDIDGTITKSDVLGHILPMMGKDWAQLGVAQLFSKIEQNGYKLLYLSARAIGQSRVTREYLRSIRQGDVKLPDGPLLLNPTSLISAFHREVIERKPERFKIACLTDIRELFPQKDPFYAGYGNRINDVWAYRAVGIPIKRIFTINTKGELKHELTQTFQSSYCGLTFIVDQLFPPVKPDEMAAIEYSHFNFWRDPLPDLLELNENNNNNNNNNSTTTGNGKKVKNGNKSSSKSVNDNTNSNNPSAAEKSTTTTLQQDTMTSMTLATNSTMTDDGIVGGDSKDLGSKVTSLNDSTSTSTSTNNNNNNSNSGASTLKSSTLVTIPEH